ncbi:uncharacterized protein LOC106179050 [Lingula anatina]|uniref:Uncharacterized protein LOC106179050 n=1 Tax=Lingula anatina TaxID=7574 RepID=A0A1S3K5U5_LINAN|nr:uncharacterized protein LOC106179050 [Lingula anatina]XP_013418004.1 uncharacterized protein LOC106179050 [Lingula anatina]XP_013418005.1 uncharacterized protein LOC106179050 [Lingula anatina]XP_013418006.1 uncharacterized protein LOC106179050 [Lingula anatina]XP_013418007.1 uncharacterized protein LOC106179050 [Lingula anatina]XP_013418008.1 uncharacterized protein LOC106179050 [Lingula anatina]XP_013418009.1 uncharacterized protein LOC106179050 [Lingula anatina]|eukprot:XP_013418003.1 uncharacterized protein LOC106179050 [Lingula anatina]
MTKDMSYLLNKSTQELYGKKYHEMLKRFQSKGKKERGSIKPTLSRTSVMTSGTQDSGIIHDVTHHAENHDASVSSRRKNSVASRDTPPRVVVSEDQADGGEEPSQIQRPQTKGSLGLGLLSEGFASKERSKGRKSATDQSRSHSEPSFLPPITPGQSGLMTPRSRYAQSLSPLSRREDITPLPSPSISPRLSTLPQQNTSQQDHESSDKKTTSTIGENSSPPNIKQEMLHGLGNSHETTTSQESNPDAQHSKRKRRKLKFEREPTIITKHEEYQKHTRELTKQLHLKSKPMDLRKRPPKAEDVAQFAETSKDEEQFSIRKKIEQFRKWHEDQYKEKLEKLRLDSEKAEYSRTPQVPVLNGTVQDVLKKYHNIDADPLEVDSLKMAVVSVDRRGTDSLKMPVPAPVSIKGAAITTRKPPLDEVKSSPQPVERQKTRIQRKARDLQISEKGSRKSRRLRRMDAQHSEDDVTIQTETPVTSPLADDVIQRLNESGQHKVTSNQSNANMGSPSPKEMTLAQTEQHTSHQVNEQNTSQPATNEMNPPPERDQKSAGTWRTWRDVNESDAYNDVKKYIIDNDLMNAEKEQWISSWVNSVDVAREVATPMTEERIVAEQLAKLQK